MSSPFFIERLAENLIVETRLKTMMHGPFQNYHSTYCIPSVTTETIIMCCLDLGAGLTACPAGLNGGIRCLGEYF